MAWTTPRTWVAGEVVTAALMNTHLRDNLVALRDAKPGAKMNMSADQSVPNGGALVLLNTSVYDTDTMVDGANNRLVCKTGGVFRIVGSVAWADAAGFQRGTLVRVNGGAVGQGRYEPGNNSGFSGQVVQEVLDIRLAVNDTLSIYANQNTGANVTVFGSGANGPLTFLSAWRVAA